MTQIVDQPFGAAEPFKQILTAIRVVSFDGGPYCVRLGRVAAIREGLLFPNCGVREQQKRKRVGMAEGSSWY